MPDVSASPPRREIPNETPRRKIKRSGRGFPGCQPIQRLLNTLGDSLVLLGLFISRESVRTLESLLCYTTPIFSHKQTLNRALFFIALQIFRTFRQEQVVFSAVPSYERRCLSVLFRHPACPFPPRLLSCLYLFSDLFSVTLLIHHPPPSPTPIPITLASSLLSLSSPLSFSTSRHPRSVFKSHASIN